MERGMNTKPLPTIVKMLQTDEILHAEKGIMASVHDVWDEYNKLEQEGTIYTFQLVWTFSEFYKTSICLYEVRASDWKICL